MLELIQKLFGEAVTPEKLDELTEALEQNYAPKQDFVALQEKLAEVQEEHVQRLEALQKENLEKEFSFILEQALKAAGAKNVTAVRALLDTEALQLEEGEIAGLSEQLEQLKAENGFLFEEPVCNLQFVRPLGTGKSLVSLEEFQKMGYMERVKLKKEQPDLYRKLLQQTGGKLCRLI